MVQFHEDGFTITIKTDGSSPIEYWMNIQKELICLFQNLDDDLICKQQFHALDLLLHLMPDWDTAKKMIE